MTLKATPGVAVSPVMASTGSGGGSSAGTGTTTQTMTVTASGTQPPAVSPCVPSKTTTDHEISGIFQDSPDLWLPSCATLIAGDEANVPGAGAASEVGRWNS